MAPGSSTESGYHPWRETLLETAWASIRHGLEYGRALSLDPADYPEPLQRPGACFVTLERFGQLRGCIGTLEAWRPLIEDVAENAYAAAFRDPRFPPLSHEELEGLELEISILGSPEPIQFSSETELLRQLEPGVDGLILEERGHRGTFLPTVWQSLPEPREFLRQLKRKAGLPPDYWSPTVRVWRYRTELIR